MVRAPRGLHYYSPRAGASWALVALLCISAGRRGAVDGRDAAESSRSTQARRLREAPGRGDGPFGILVADGLKYCTDAAVDPGELALLAQRVEGGPGTPWYSASMMDGGGVAVQISLPKALIEDIAALVVPGGDHGGAVARCFEHAAADRRPGMDTARLAQWVLIESANLCSEVGIGREAIYGLRAAMRSPASAAVTLAGLREQVFGQNGTTLEMHYPEQVFAAVPAILQMSGDEAELHLQCTRGMVRGGDDYLQDVWGSAGPLAVLVMQNAFAQCAPGAGAVGDWAAAWQASGRFLNLLTEYTSKRKGAREFPQSYAYTGGRGGLSAETGELDASAALRFALRLREPFLRHAARAMALASTTGGSEGLFYSCMQGRLAMPGGGIDPQLLAVGLMWRLNDDCGLPMPTEQQLVGLAEALRDTPIALNASEPEAGVWDMTFEIPLAAVLTGVNTLGEQGRSPSYGGTALVRECFLNLLEGKLYNNLPQFDYSLTTELLNSCGRPSELGRAVRTAMDSALRSSGGHIWSHVLASGAVTAWGSIPGGRLALIHDIYTRSQGGGDPKLLECMESWLETAARPRSEPRPSSEPPGAAAAVLKAAVLGCSDPASSEEIAAWATDLLREEASASDQDQQAPPRSSEGVAVVVEFSKATILAVASKIAAEEPGGARAEDAAAACLLDRLQVTAASVGEASAPPASPSGGAEAPAAAVGVAAALGAAAILAAGAFLWFKTRPSAGRRLRQSRGSFEKGAAGPPPAVLVDASKSSWLLMGASRRRFVAAQNRRDGARVGSLKSAFIATQGSPQVAVLAFVYRLHFSRACLSIVYAALVKSRGRQDGARKLAVGSGPMRPPLPERHSAPGSPGGLGPVLAEERLMGATSLQLKNALLCKNIEGQGPDFNIDFAKDLKPFLRGRLGAGAFGTVYRGRWKGKPVAVKVMHAGTFQGHEASRKLQSFAKEVSIMSGYRQSENLLHLHGACLRRPHVAIVYELMAGNLGDRIYSPLQDPMELLEALHVARAVAGGLDELHPDVVHRDLKPQNILLTANGQAKIADFGLSRSIINPLDSTSSPAGTPLYMSPEAFDGQWTTPGDIWAFGVVLNECLARERPFADLDLAQTFQVVYRVAFEHMHPTVAAGIPKGLASLILDCWKTVPEERPCIKEVIRRLDAVIDAETGLQREGAADAAADECAVAGLTRTPTRVRVQLPRKFASEKVPPRSLPSHAAGMDPASARGGPGRPMSLFEASSLLTPF